MLVKQSRTPIKEIITIGLLPSPLKIIYYRSRGAKIGKGVKIGFGSVVVADKIEIGDYTTIGFATILRGREIKIGSHTRIGSTVFFDVERISIGDDAKINEQVFAGGPMLPESYLEIGSRTIVMQHTFLNPTKPLIIGDGTGIGGKCSIFTHGSWQNILEGYPVQFAPVTLGENVWIPWQVFIMPGVDIGDNATIGADSLVTRDIPPGCLAVGKPARVIKSAEEYPPKLGPEEKREITQNLLAEFRNYMEYEKIKVESLEIAEQLEIWNFLSSENTPFTLIYRVSPEASIPVSKVSAQTFCLSLPPFTASEILEIEKRGAMWTDLTALKRGGKPNDLGEELVLFLSRYGLRFERTKII